MSHDSLSDKGDDAEVSPDAIEALGKAKGGAFIISSSNEIKDDDNDPPAYKAKNEYVKIVDKVKGSFKCVDDHKKDGKNVPLVLEFSNGRLKYLPAATLAKSSSASDSAVNSPP